jgi:hypothetical protein
MNIGIACDIQLVSAENFCSRALQMFVFFGRNSNGGITEIPGRHVETKE